MHRYIDNGEDLTYSRNTDTEVLIDFTLKYYSACMMFQKKSIKSNPPYNYCRESQSRAVFAKMLKSYLLTQNGAKVK